LPLLPDLEYYIQNNCFPGGTTRNWKSYGDAIGEVTDFQKTILADPQTSGGLLIAVEREGVLELQNVLRENGFEGFAEPIGEIVEMGEGKVIGVS